MNIRILGNNLESWTLAAALSSTGCRVTVTADQLPDEQGEIAEADLLRLLQKQQDQQRLQLVSLADTSVQPSDQLQSDCLLLIDARTNLDATARFAALQAFAAQAELPSAGQKMTYALVQPVAVGTTDQLQAMLSAKAIDTVNCLYWPAFIEAGRALESFTRAGRVIIGGEQAEAIELIRQLMQPFNRSKDASLLMTAKEAELTKIAINGMLATRISFMNELAELSARQGVDIEAVRHGLGSDPRIGHQYLYPGCGFGGDAFVNTLDFLSQELEGKALTGQAVNTAGSTPSQGGLLQSVYGINEQQKDLLFQKFWRYFKAEIKGRTVALWGCAFKPNTSGIAGSPALILIEGLLAHGVKVNIYDPMAMATLQAKLGLQPLLTYCNSPEQAADQADAIMLVTEWKLFWNLNLAAIAAGMKTPLLLDGRNIYPPQQAEQAGLIYSGIGRGRSL